MIDRDTHLGALRFGARARAWIYRARSVLGANDWGQL